MAEVRPFKGIYYDASKVDVQKVVTQPWDVITPEIQERYYSEDPRNIVRIIRGKEMPGDNDSHNKFTRAGEYFREWLSQGVFVRDQEDSFYVYSQKFRLGASELIRRGIVAAVRLEDYESKVILPHEHTFASHNADRLHLVRETRANFGQIFVLYPDREMTIAHFLARYDAAEPLMSVTTDGVAHSVRRMTSRDDIEFIVEQMKSKQLFIADGHHRYHTALMYRDEMVPKLSQDGRREVSYRMMTLVSMDDPGVTILPTHRVVRGAADFSQEGMVEKLHDLFDVNMLEREAGSLQPLLDRLRESAELGTSFVVCFREGKVLLIRLKERASAVEAMSGKPHRSVRELDVTILHSLIFERILSLSAEAQESGEYISYFRDASEAVSTVERGEGQMCFLLNPTKVQQVRDVALAGEVMPHKSTDFYPKLLTGLIMRKLDI